MANTELQKSREEVAEPVHERPAVAPRVDIYENRDEFLLIADLPGIRSSDLSIHVEGAELSLEAPRQVGGFGAPIVREHRELDFRRAFLLPQGLDRERIEAELKDGVLRLHLPKSDAHRPRQIAVRAG